MTPRRPLETLGRLLGRPRAPPGAPGRPRRRALKSTSSILVAPGGSRDPPGRALGPSRATFGRPGGRLCDPKRRPTKSNNKVPYFELHGPIFSIWEVLQELVFPCHFFNTRVFDYDVWKHSRSCVRVIKFKLFVVFIFSTFRYCRCLKVLDMSSQIRPLVRSSLVSVFVSKSYQKWSQNGVWRVPKVQKSS